MPGVKKVLPKKKATTKKAAKRAKALDRGSDSDVLMRIQQLKDVGGEGVKLNVYGRQGTGKTRFACTFPKPLFLLGLENGTRSVRRGKRAEGIEYVQCFSPEEYEQVVEFVAATDKYRTLVIDTASTLQMLILEDICGKKLPEQLSWGIVSRDQWTKCGLETKRCLRLGLDLADQRNLNVIIIAQEREFNNKGSDDGEGFDSVVTPYVGSAMMPTVTGWLNPACDYICQAFIKARVEKKRIPVPGKKGQFKERETPVPGKVDFCLRVAPHQIFTTKVRESFDDEKEFPEYIVNPTYQNYRQFIE